MITAKVTAFVDGPTSSGMLRWYAAQLECGHRWYDRADSWAPITGVNVGDLKPCETCANEADALADLETRDFSKIHHARARRMPGGRYSYHFYRLEPTSPSNFMLEFSAPATPAIDELLRRKRCSPISPTEPA